MSGLSLKLPVNISPVDGFYSLTKDLKENTKQSLKMIVLTSPGERIMKNNICLNNFPILYIERLKVELFNKLVYTYLM